MKNELAAEMDVELEIDVIKNWTNITTTEGQGGSECSPGQRGPCPPTAHGGSQLGASLGSTVRCGRACANTRSGPYGESPEHYNL
jgi:hypothetical protein